jgi:hypothetical protein
MQKKNLSDIGNKTIKNKKKIQFNVALGVFIYYKKKI